MIQHCKSAKAVIVISSHVVRGSVGNRAAVFALETLGFPVWAIPTITLPWHPGHGAASRLVARPEEFSSLLEDIARAPWISEVGAVLSGFMANSEQARAVAKLVASLKSQNPDCTYLCDPVIGDVGGLYVAGQTACAIRDHLVPLCDIATPNCHELAWLTGKETPKTVAETVDLANGFAPETVITTSCPMNDPSQTGNLYVSKKTTLIASHKRFEDPPNGPGDLTAALFLGHQLEGLEPPENLSITTSSVFEILQNATRKGSDELTLESDAKSIITPSQSVQVSKL